jgi:ferredoxin
VWAGRSDGGDCAICRARVERGEMEYELEYIRNGLDPGVDTHHVHIRCFTRHISKFQDPEVGTS